MRAIHGTASPPMQPSRLWPTTKYLLKAAAVMLPMTVLLLAALVMLALVSLLFLSILTAAFLLMVLALTMSAALLLAIALAVLTLCLSPGLAFLLLMVPSLQSTLHLTQVPPTVLWSLVAIVPLMLSVGLIRPLMKKQLSTPAYR